MRTVVISEIGSPFTIRAATFLVEKMGLSAIEIASGRVVYHDLLDHP